MRKVEVVPYSNEWEKKFEEESEQLREIFGSEIVTIHHIGSTSVNRLKSKPIIDIMPVVQDITKMDNYNDRMIAIGYEPKGENGIPGRRYFKKGGDQRTHHIHIYEKDNCEIERHLAFREYLRMHANVSKEYGDLKEALAKQFPYDIELYINGKAQLASEIEREALKWFREINNSKY